jgi:ABC transport system ATP-binding/permease protein
MVLPVVLSIHDAYVTFGGKPLFEQLSFCIHEGEKICLVGKNGAGKTTLMHMITGTKDLDGGTRWQAHSTTIGYLQQHIDINPNQTIYDFIFSGLRPEKQNDIYAYMVEVVTEPFELDPQAKMGSLSGGQVRRAALARSLVEEPDILLLDEPTNHLDLGATLWLEEYLKAYKGALLCISHDKTFLANISQKIFWLDRGGIRVCPKGFGHFDEWSEMLLEQEERELRNRERALAVEVEWASRGVKARRKRNMRRVADMQAERDRLRMDKSLFNKAIQKIEMEPIKDPEVSSKIVLEFYKVSFGFAKNQENKNQELRKLDVKENDPHPNPLPEGEGAGYEALPGEERKKKAILSNFNLRVMRGDRIGILGKNGSGKTSFLKLLLGELEPDSGKIKLAKNVEISYFDQKRRDLDDDNTLWNTLCPGGGDYVDVFGKPRHVCGYLKDFMFDPKDARNRVGTLSGGQKNRLMLAKVLANPGSFLILDEPTNDLDMDTLDMLEEVLSQYKGTLFVVSHDRDFLDQTVTKILAFEGDAVVEGYIGGYSDYLEAKGGLPLPLEEGRGEGRARNKDTKTKDNSAVPNSSLNNSNSNPLPRVEGIRKLSYKLQFELDNLPARISAIEKELVHLNHLLADSALYMNDPELFDKSSRLLARKQEELEAAELRWLELEDMRNSIS